MTLPFIQSPTIKTSNLPKLADEVSIAQTEALAKLADSVNSLSEFVTGGGLSTLLSSYARTQAVQAILGGLASHDGRNSLDARVLGQNAIEAVTAIEAMFTRFQEVMEAKAKGEERDSEIHDAETSFKTWAKMKELKSKE